MTLERSRESVIKYLDLLPRLRRRFGLVCGVAAGAETPPLAEHDRVAPPALRAQSLHPYPPAPRKRRINTHH